MNFISDNDRESPQIDVLETVFYLTGFLAVVLVFLAGMFIGEWREGVANDARLESVHKDGVAVGYQLAINTNAPMNETCLAFWFSGDTKCVSKAIKQIKLEN